MTDTADFRNRLQKMWRHHSKKARRAGYEAYRVYDRDIPLYPFTVDVYGDRLCVAEFVNEAGENDPRYIARRTQALADIAEILAVAPEKIFLRQRRRRAENEQYEKRHESRDFFTVNELGLNYRVNLRDYLDTGLFLDQRPNRHRVRELAAGKRVLNLFCYTGSFTVAAAAGGARETVSVDTSATYLDWAQENLKLNNLSSQQHCFVRQDAREFLAQYQGELFDIIVCDPPVFSKGKLQQRDFDVLRDHPQLIDDCLRILSAEGVLFFSTNFRKFSIRWQGSGSVKNTSHLSIPEDFRDKKIHTSYEIRKGGDGTR